MSVFPLGQDRRETIARVRRARLRAGLMICDRLRSDCARVWAGLHAHPFIRELAAGTLPPETFRFYVEQNLQYLPEYAARSRSAPPRPRTSRPWAASRPTSRTSSRVRSRRTASFSGACSSSVRRIGVARLHGARERRLHRLSRLRGDDGRAARDHGGDRAVHLELRRHRVVADRRRSRARPSGLRRVDPLLRPAGVRGIVEAMKAGSRGARRRCRRGDGAAALVDLHMSTRLERAFWDMAFGHDQWPDVACRERRARGTGRLRLGRHDGDGASRRPGGSWPRVRRFSRRSKPREARGGAYRAGRPPPAAPATSRSRRRSRGCSRAGDGVSRTSRRGVRQRRHRRPEPRLPRPRRRLLPAGDRRELRRVLHRRAGSGSPDAGRRRDRLQRLDQRPGLRAGLCRLQRVEGRAGAAGPDDGEGASAHAASG